MGPQASQEASGAALTSVPPLQLDVYVVSSPVPQLHVGCESKKGCFCLTEMVLNL